MARPEGFELPTLCFEGRLASSCNSRHFNHRVHSSRLSRDREIVPGCARMYPSDRRVTTKVTTFFVEQSWSDDVKPKMRVVPISQLVLDEKNANKGTKRGRELLEESLGKYGAGRSVVVDRHNRVIAGNKTVEAARAAGIESIAVIETDGSSLVAVQRGDLDLKRDKKARGACDCRQSR